MKKILFSLFLLILPLVLIFQNNANPNIIISGLMKKGGIHPGDLKYRINLFGIIPVAEAVLYLEKEAEYKGQKVYHLSASALTMKWLSKFFEGSAVFDSYVEMRDLTPLLFKQKIKALGKENPDKEIFYNQKEGTMSLGGVERSILPKTHDPLSAIFNLRRSNFDNLRTIEININTNQKNYLLSGIVKRRDLSIRKEIYKTVLLKADIRRRDKESYHRSNISMLLVKSGENIPVLIKVFASGVLINAKLISIR